MTTAQTAGRTTAGTAGTAARTVAQVNQWHGMYEGVVVSAVDPTGVGRLLVRVPEVLGDETPVWAVPVTPLAGSDCGMYVVPPPDSGVWVQFLDGDPERAVWAGFRRGGSGDVPSAARSTPPGVPQIVLATPTGNALVLSDLPGPTGGIKLQLHGENGPFIRINETSIEISCGPGLATIQLVGPQVIVNNGALTVL
ncbi:phage baseplate assembly protein V [Streptomyces soliscabiei]|uniref:phage baseplate assembly protein V n=1 Tax=Streptomyces soliscabiei TaxID=588897 RepID=UPI0029A1CA1C|nr:phage baseplate assembly protein V [Streptomyces sp. NY05-11A]MDX2681622.1 phage baseplate assembly protein V [Streptomyces sp. NY05-11A]